MPRTTSLIFLAMVFVAVLQVPVTRSAGAQDLSRIEGEALFATPDAPLNAAVGIEINQVTDVNQKAENFGVVLTIRMKWKDTALAFDANELGREYRLMSVGSLLDLANEQGTLVPSFVIKNQQGNRWVNDALTVVFADGTTEFFEQATMTLQAPHFDFTRYPFDRQIFYVEIVSNLPAEFVKFSILEDNSGLGDMLGEEEWILENASMEVTTAKGISGRESSRIALAFEGRRHIQYYVTRIFLPMLVLIVVSWATFFLDEYRKRIEIAGANLLVFVGFNWIISDNLPKLGYLTFLDFILQWMFVVTGGIIVVNVALRRLKVGGHEQMAKRIDNYVIKWIYPFGYAGIVLFAAYLFLLQG